MSTQVLEVLEYPVFSLRCRCPSTLRDTPGSLPRRGRSTPWSLFTHRLLYPALVPCHTCHIRVDTSVPRPDGPWTSLHPLSRPSRRRTIPRPVSREFTVRFLKTDDTPENVDDPKLVPRLNWSRVQSSRLNPTIILVTPLICLPLL